MAVDPPRITISVTSESATKATGSNGLYTYTFQHAIPADASGTWTIGIEDTAT